MLHFCSLGYNRRGDLPQPEGGATCHHWLDVKRLQWQPFFEEYVRDAFNPIGVMLDFWDETIQAGTRRTVKLIFINDLAKDWQGRVRVKVLHQQKSLLVCSQPVAVAALESGELLFELPFPSADGDYELAAELTGPGARNIHSRRNFKIVSETKADPK